MAERSLECCGARDQNRARKEGRGDTLQIAVSDLTCYDPRRWMDGFKLSARNSAGRTFVIAIVARCCKVAITILVDASDVS